MEMLTFKGKTVPYDSNKKYGILEQQGNTIGVSRINIVKFVAGFAAQPHGEELAKIVYELCEENYQFLQRNLQGAAGEESFTIPAAPENEMQQALEELRNT